MRVYSPFSQPEEGPLGVRRMVVGAAVVGLAVVGAAVTGLVVVGLVVRAGFGWSSVIKGRERKGKDEN